jgi:hypothetical protein
MTHSGHQRRKIKHEDEELEAIEIESTHTIDIGVDQNGSQHDAARPRKKRIFRLLSGLGRRIARV